MVCRGYIQIGILTNTYTYKEEEKSVAKKKSIATVVTVDGHKEDGHCSVCELRSRQPGADAGMYDSLRSIHALNMDTSAS